MQEVLSELQSMDPVRRALPEERNARGSAEAPSTKSPKPREAQTCVTLPCCFELCHTEQLGPHVDLKTICKFAQLEYKLGDPERGKTIFEGIVDSHPKRWDMWSIYMDMEAGQGDIMSLRYVYKPYWSRARR